MDSNNIENNNSYEFSCSSNVKHYFFGWLTIFIFSFILFLLLISSLIILLSLSSEDLPSGKYFVITIIAIQIFFNLILIVISGYKSIKYYFLKEKYKKEQARQEFMILTQIDNKLRTNEKLTKEEKKIKKKYDKKNINKEK